MSVRTEAPLLEDIYNQAANAGTLDEQIDDMKALANEAGTTVEALAAARQQREVEAAARMKLDPSTVVVSNEGDDWRNNEER